MNKAMIAVVLALAPGAVLADDKVDCTDPQTQMELGYCAQQAYLAADKELNAAYKKAMAAMERIDSYLEPDQRGGADALKKAQREWIPYRDGACQMEGYLVAGGSMLGQVVNSCLERITRQRIGDLDILIEGMGN